MLLNLFYFFPECIRQPCGGQIDLSVFKGLASDGKAHGFGLLAVPDLDIRVAVGASEGCELAVVVFGPVCGGDPCTSHDT